MLYYVIFCSAGNQKINLPLEDGFYHPLMVIFGIFFFFVGFTTLYYITGQSMSIDILSASRQPAIWMNCSTVQQVFAALNEPHDLQGLYHHGWLHFPVTADPLFESMGMELQFQRHIGRIILDMDLILWPYVLIFNAVPLI